MVGELCLVRPSKITSSKNTHCYGTITTNDKAGIGGIDYICTACDHPISQTSGTIKHDLTLIPKQIALIYQGSPPIERDAIGCDTAIAL